jgi:tetratricopeptide (TPR) repeat protein
MRRSLVVLVVVAAACSVDQAPDNTGEWLHVLNHKRAAMAPAATTRQKQAYADSVAAFVGRYPNHGRAREVYTYLQLDFARELVSFGRYREAIRFYRAVLARDPQNRAALSGISYAIDRLAVSRDKLLALEKGMSQRDVARLLGTPIPGWTVRTERRDCVIESWYYRKNGGGVAGVYFRDGELFAAEENSEAKLVPLIHAAN